MLRTGHLLRPASNPASRPRTGASLPGTLASPRTGLAPAGCPQLIAWLRHHNMNLLVVMASKLLDAPPDRQDGGGYRLGPTGTAQQPPVGCGLVRTIGRGLLLFAATVCIFGAVITLTSGLQPGASGSGGAGVEMAATPQPTLRVCLSTERCVPVAPFNSSVTVPPIVSIGFVAAALAVLIDLRRRRAGLGDGRLALAVRSAIFRPPIAR